VGGTAWSGVEAVFRSPRLRLIAGYLLLMTFASTVLYFQQAEILGAAFTDRGERRAFLARLDFSVNTLTLLGQGLVVAHVMRRFGVGVGTLVLLVNTVLLTLYTFSCHSWRHLVGGGVDCFSCASLGKARLGAWQHISAINRHHMLFAWVSLTSVGLADLYVRLVSMGIWRDLRIL